MDIIFQISVHRFNGNFDIKDFSVQIKHILHAHASFSFQLLKLPILSRIFYISKMCTYYFGGGDQASVDNKTHSVECLSHFFFILPFINLPVQSVPSEGVSESCSVMSDSLQPHGLYSSWNSPGQNAGVGSLFLLQGIKAQSPTLQVASSSTEPKGSPSLSCLYSLA